MEKIHNFWKWFNRPAQVFETLGYIVVAVGVFIAVVGTIVSLFSTSTHGNGYSNPLFFLVIGTAVAIVAPQAFFAIAKVVQAAEKYLGER